MSEFSIRYALNPMMITVAGRLKACITSWEMINSHFFVTHTVANIGVFETTTLLILVPNFESFRKVNFLSESEKNNSF